MLFDYIVYVDTNTERVLTLKVGPLTMSEYNLIINQLDFICDKLIRAKDYTVSINWLPHYEEKKLQ